MRKRIYVAGPYSASTREEREENVARMIEVGDKIFQAGGAPFLPVLSHYWDLYSPKGYEDWMEIVSPWVCGADALYRTMGRSRRADREVDIACINGVPVYFEYDSDEFWVWLRS